MPSPLEKEFRYYLENQAELVRKHNGKVLVIRDCAVVGEYDSEAEAIKAASKLYELGTFLVQKCEPGVDSTTQTFHSRAVFA